MNGNGGCVLETGEIIPYGAPGCIGNIGLTPDDAKLIWDWEEDLIRIIEEQDNCPRPQ